jgi:hypothetical protein
VENEGDGEEVVLGLAASNVAECVAPHCREPTSPQPKSDVSDFSRFNDAELG